MEAGTVLLNTGSAVDETRKPFELGWKREIVYRQNTTNSLCDVYYFSPGGKKMRSLREIATFLNEKKESNLALANFTFKRKELSRPPAEIVRRAGKSRKLGCNPTAFKEFKEHFPSAPDLKEETKIKDFESAAKRRNNISTDIKETNPEPDSDVKPFPKPDSDVKPFPNFTTTSSLTDLASTPSQTISSNSVPSKLREFLHLFCHDYVQFQSDVELTGYISLNIDKREMVQYCLHENVSRLPEKINNSLQNIVKAEFKSEQL